MRKSIFDISSSNINIPSEVKRIIHISTIEKTLLVDNSFEETLFDFVEAYCFEEWSQRGHCISCDDFLETLHYDTLIKQAESSPEALLTYIELMYNFWFLAQSKFEDFDKDYELQWLGNFHHLQKLMNDLLDQYNHIAIIGESGDYILVVENKEEITAAAEILPEKLAFDVIKYNHRALKGEIEIKKSILISLGAELEPRRKELQNLNKQLAEDIFFLLNNINIRHNNCTEQDKAKYKDTVAQMTNEQLEGWYDELYQMILLAFLLLDNVDRTSKVKELKDKIAGGNN